MFLLLVGFIATMAKADEPQRTATTYNTGYCSVFISLSSSRDDGSYVNYHNGTQWVSQSLRSISGSITVKKGTSITIQTVVIADSGGTLRGGADGYGVSEMGGVFSGSYSYTIDSNRSISIWVQDLGPMEWYY